MSIRHLVLFISAGPVHISVGLLMVSESRLFVWVMLLEVVGQARLSSSLQVGLSSIYSTRIHSEAWAEEKKVARAKAETQEGRYKCKPPKV